MDDFYVITGGPGAGKTTLIEALEARGYGQTIEAGRFISQVQAAVGGPAGHAGDRVLYAELMLMHEIRSYAAATGTTFFDRGVPELCGYLEMCGLPVPAHFERAAALYRYNRTVFAAPPWREIFVNDAERKQDFAEAITTYERCTAAYRARGYEIVDLPKVSVQERVEFVMGKLGGGGGGARLGEPPNS